MRKYAIALLLVIAGLGVNADALGIDTHRLINRHAAVSAGDFERVLSHRLGFRNSLATRFRRGPDDGSVIDWLGEGGAREDDAFRYLFHFHDPLRPLDSAGLGLGPARFASSMKWMDDPAQFWSWPSARVLYYNALTETDPVRREALWADLFRALGQIMHLVVDASVPEHTRNDMHPLGALKIQNSYERWVGSQHPAVCTREADFIARYLSSPIGAAAVVPTGRLIDANQYDGTNPGITVGPDAGGPVAAGLAEIANANFFSEDTLRGQYPSPTDAGLIPVNLITPLGKVRRYFSRPAGLGLLPANPLKAECASDGLYVAGIPVRRAPYPCVDPLVWNQVAAHMLPRAVGYARGVLDYFFRGSMAVNQVTWDDSGIFVEIENTGSEAMEGTFEIWARHEPDSDDERRMKLVTLNGGEPVTVAPGDRFWFTGVTVSASMPAARHVLVFRGRLGAEEGAVAAQVFTVAHADVTQTSYVASTRITCAPPTGTAAPLPLPKTTVMVRSESATCMSQVASQIYDGLIRTNAPRDPITGTAEPILARIEALWAGSMAPAAISLDGGAPVTMWQRAGNEPDPARFQIADTAERPSSTTPFVRITDVSGRQLLVGLSRIAVASFSHEKFMLLDNRTASGPTLIASRRGTVGSLALDASRFDVVSHSGLVPPVSEARTRPFGNSGIAEGRLALGTVYLNMTIDDFEVFADAGEGERLYDSISLRAPHPAGPAYGWEATLRRRYGAGEREFLKAFVAAVPEPYEVQLRGAAVSETGTQ